MEYGVILYLYIFNNGMIDIQEFDPKDMNNGPQFRVDWLYGHEWQY